MSRIHSQSSGIHSRSFGIHSWSSGIQSRSFCDPFRDILGSDHYLLGSTHNLLGPRSWSSGIHPRSPGILFVIFLVPTHDLLGSTHDLWDPFAIFRGPFTIFGGSIHDLPGILQGARVASPVLPSAAHIPYPLTLGRLHSTAAVPGSYPMVLTSPKCWCLCCNWAALSPIASISSWCQVSTSFRR